MLAEPVAVPRYGDTQPRLAPPEPLRSEWVEFRDLAAKLGIELYPWQEWAARYLTAKDAGTRWLYREVAIVVARQNGKTTLLVPLVLGRLLAGQSIMHTAQNGKLPREIHQEVAGLLERYYPKLLPHRRAISYAIGHEEINLVNGAQYRIVAPTRGGARGPSTDTVIIDELREMVDHSFIGAAKPTLTASAQPQMIYLSNAGTDESEVLNAVRSRRDTDPALAYLEWSAPAALAPDDVAGWAASNPSLGHKPDVMQTLIDDYRADLLGGTLAMFETEHLCRWVPTMRERLLDEHAWARSEVVALPAMQAPVMGLAMDPGGRRASAALAWQTDDGVAVQMLFDVTGDPIDPVALGQRMKDEAAKRGVRKVGFDPLTDAELVKHFREPVSIAGGKFANATANFVTHVNGGRLRHADAAAVTDDLAWTARKPHDESGSYQAVRAKDDRPIPAALAAIRAVWLASGPTTSKPKVYVR